MYIYIGFRTGGSAVSLRFYILPHPSEDKKTQNKTQCIGVRTRGRAVNLTPLGP